ncbi:MAG: hypothetical protein QOG82_1491 [Actinomycetota bacterium]|jgi:hypothetical protein|nr:hypothetical protein [Actinomycetota bacterium]
MHRRLAATDPAGLDWALNNLADCLAAVGRVDEAKLVADEVAAPTDEAEPAN